MGTLFPIFFISEDTVVMQICAALVVGVVAACVPAWKAARVRIVDGLRAVA
jgi:putative ABC transport system permease protein